MKVAIFCVFASLFVACAFAESGIVTIRNDAMGVVMGTLNYQPEGSDGDADSEKEVQTDPIMMGSEGTLEIPDGATDVFVGISLDMLDIFGQLYDAPITKCFTVEEIDDIPRATEKKCSS